MILLAKRIGLLVTILWSSLTLAACQVTEPPVTATATAAPVVVATTASATATATSTATPATATPTMISPTITLTPSPEVTAVPPTPSATPQATESSVKIFQERESFSPDGQWRAYTLLTFVEEDGNVVGYQTDLTVCALDDDTCWQAYSTLQGAGLGYRVPTVLVWSGDGRSLFFTLRAVPDGCGFLLGTFDSGLYQLDLTNGTVAQLEFSGDPSPDGLKVAQFSWEPAAVQIYDLASQTTTTVALAADLEQGNTAVNLLWSPNSQAVALEYVTGGVCVAGDYSLIHLDLMTGEQTVLISQAQRPFSVAEWPNPQEIYLQEHTQDGQKWRLDVETGDLTVIE